MKSKASIWFGGGGGAESIGSLFVRAVVLLVFACLTTPLYAATPWLHVDGNEIKDPAGNVVVLRGVSTIDLGFLEGWQGGAINMIDRLTDKTDTQGTSPGWYTRILRIPVHPPDAVGNWPHRFDPDDDSFYNNLLRPVIDYCAARDIYAIIDWHYIDDTWDKVEQTSEFWEYMAPRFAGDSHVLFEIFNEPINNSGGSQTERWLTFRGDAQTWVDIIRTHAPDNLILVGGPQWSQIIAPAATYPVSGGNIVYVAHVYPAHWLGIYGSQSFFKGQITTCTAAHPVIMTEWGFTTTSEVLLNGTITNYGRPLMDFLEQNGVGNTAWVASTNWGPPMFHSNWTLRCGEGEMGCFVKDMLYARRNDDRPGPYADDFADFAALATHWRRSDCRAANAWCSGADYTGDGAVLLDDLQEFADAWLTPAQ